MKYYLSSYEIGKETEKLKSLIPKGKVGYIPNARDYTGVDLDRYVNRSKKDMDSLRELGIEVEMINLCDYFGRGDKLKKKIEEIGAIFISGGNVFVLRQAMKLSGLDKILKELQNERSFLYAGYSAAGCVLSPSLKSYEIVDKTDTPYEGQKEVIWNGLGLIDFAFMSHWDSDHPESADVEKEIAYCQENNISYRAIRDGEVIIIE